MFMRTLLSASPGSLCCGLACLDLQAGWLALCSLTHNLRVGLPTSFFLSLYLFLPPQDSLEWILPPSLNFHCHHFHLVKPILSEKCHNF